ncbi:MAG: hypothetical protein LBV34_27290 [Nocardiopsaceae bacterium]|jgi:hypothetical protein|nr:hypothetical protein [Nocardiopsaceae bacterium]
MATEHGQGTPSQDDFERQLRDLYSGTAGAPKFREPSAAERARRASRRRQASRQQSRRPLGWGRSRKARKLRQPVTEVGANTGAGSGMRRGKLGRLWHRLARFGRPGPRRPLAPGERRRRLRSFAKGTAILIGFVALLFLMHMLGLGPK